MPSNRTSGTHAENSHLNLAGNVLSPTDMNSKVSANELYYARKTNNITNSIDKGHIGDKACSFSESDFVLKN